MYNFEEYTRKCEESGKLIRIENWKEARDLCDELYEESIKNQKLFQKFRKAVGLNDSMSTLAEGLGEIISDNGKHLDNLVSISLYIAENIPPKSINVQGGN